MWALRRILYRRPNLLSLTTDVVVHCRAASTSTASASQQVRQNVLMELSNQSTNWNVSTKSVMAAVRNSPELLQFSPSEWNSAFYCLQAFGIKGPQIIHMFQKCPSLLTVDPKSMTAIWDALTLFKLSTHKLVGALLQKPHILCNPPTDAEEKALLIITYSGAGNNALRVLTVCNNPFALSLAELTEVTEYVHHTMKVKRTYEICRSKVFECPISKLKCRHSFLVDCGLYVPQDDDIPTTIPHSNPLLCDIVNTKDEVFAEKVAKLTYEEYIVYQELFEKRRLNEMYEDIDDD